MSKEDLAEFYSILKKSHLTISLAESCTGGLISKILTDIAGSSKYFLGSYVTYSNELKISMLNVNIDTLNNFGAVSKEVAREMAEGVELETKADISISVTGIAGPDGGTEEKPIGTVFIGFCSKKQNVVFKYLFDGNRKEVREKTMQSVLQLIENYILEKPNNKNYVEFWSFE